MMTMNDDNELRYDKREGKTDDTHHSTELITENNEWVICIFFFYTPIQLLMSIANRLIDKNGVETFTSTFTSIELNAVGITVIATVDRTAFRPGCARILYSNWTMDLMPGCARNWNSI